MQPDRGKTFAHQVSGWPHCLAQMLPKRFKTGLKTQGLRTRPGFGSRLGNSHAGHGGAGWTSERTAVGRRT